jgi:hypothetical protein
LDLILSTLLFCEPIVFDAFMNDRQSRLQALIEEATGKAAYSGSVQEEGIDVEADDDAIEAELTLA